MMKKLNLKKVAGILGVIILVFGVTIFCVIKKEKPAEKPAQEVIPAKPELPEQARQEVVVTTDKIKYKYGENIIITISNELLENISFFPHLGGGVVVEKSLNGIWETLHIAYPSNTIAYLKKLKPGEKIDFKWDQTMNEHGNWPQRIPVGRGKYRIKFTYYLKCPFDFPFPVEGSEKHITYSNEFIIKRKWF